MRCSISTPAAREPAGIQLNRATGGLSPQGSPAGTTSLARAPLTGHRRREGLTGGQAASGTASQISNEGLMHIAPSILSADFGRLGEQVREVAAAGGQRIH